MPLQRPWIPSSQDLQTLTNATPRCRLLGGADLNTQLTRFGNRIGPHVGTGERPGEASRLSALRNLLVTHDLKVPSTFAPFRHTRSPWPGKSDLEKHSVIDFLFSSPDVQTELWPDTRPFLGIRSDHRPIGLAAIANPPKRHQRKTLWSHNFTHPPDWSTRIPTNWQPAHPGQWARDLRNLQYNNLTEFTQKLARTAHSHQTRRTEAQQETSRLRDAAYNTHEDPVLHMAYQIRLQEHQEQQRRHREHIKLLEQARGRDWDFNRPSRTPGAARIPDKLAGHPDRSDWGNALGRFLSDLYNCEEEEAQSIHETAWQIQNAATNNALPSLKCHPNDLRNIIKTIPNYRAAGKDGIPSQILKDLPFNQITKIAALFQHLSNITHYRPQARPSDWEEALVMMLPKENGSEDLSKYRPISLMPQLQKIFTRWLLSQCGSTLDDPISESQSGYRRGRQAAETLYTIQRVIEIHLEWALPLTILKVDLRKAFDSIFQSTILKALQATQAHPRLIFNLCRELVGNRIFPQIWQCTPEEDIKLKRGSKQGAPESGAYLSWPFSIC